MGAKVDRADRFAGISSDAVQAKTGKPWGGWFAVLDAAAARVMPHPQIAGYLQGAARRPRVVVPDDDGGL